MPTMIVLVNPNDGVDPEDYERWVLESYAPVARSLPSVGDWRNHRVDALLDSEETPPYRYVVTLQVTDLEGLGRDMGSDEMQRLIRELHEFADVTHLMAERFA